MQWWNDILEWLGSTNGWRILSGAIIPFVAIVVAGVIAALIGRGATRRLVLQRDRETRAAAVAALVAAGQNAARWQSQSSTAREHAEQLAAEADVAVRLLPLSGAGLAADWAAHQLASMRTNSVSFSFQADQSLAEYRDRLVDWQRRPGRAKKLFAADLERWSYENPAVDPVVVEQQRWAEQQLIAADPPSAGTATTELPPPAATQADDRRA